MLAPHTAALSRAASRYVRAAGHACVGALLLSACYSGDVREKDPPPGYPGGKCLAPDGWCRDEGVACNKTGGAYCYDVANPCSGFFCGGSDRGLCVPDPVMLTPTCQCGPGFNNGTFALYCCPDDPALLSDPLCLGGGTGLPTTTMGDPTMGDPTGDPSTTGDPTGTTSG